MSVDSEVGLGSNEVRHIGSNEVGHNGSRLTTLRSWVLSSQGQDLTSSLLYEPVPLSLNRLHKIVGLIVVADDTDSVAYGQYRRRRYSPYAVGRGGEARVCAAAAAPYPLSAGRTVVTSLNRGSAPRPRPLRAPACSRV